MPLSDSARAELQAELEYLEAMRKELIEKLDARAQVIRAVLEPFEMGQTQLPFQQGATREAVRVRDEVRVALTGVSAVGSVGSVSPRKFASTGLRASILNVLKTRGPARAPAVAKILESEGFQNDSSTPLNTRVYNDLWRLKEAKIVENKDGVFSIKEVA